MKRKPSFLYRNSLSLALVALFLFSFTGQIFTGQREYNDELAEYREEPLSLGVYLTSGHFIQATFENWESEFLQMGMYVVLTVGLRQRGSSESKGFDGDEAVNREPDPNKKDAPWPVKKGGVWLLLYKNSLAIMFIVLFISSFSLHAVGSLNHFNREEVLKGNAPIGMVEFMGKSRFWFESFQNWQSEFIAVISIVVLSIFLRQYGSPESKPVDASFHDTGTE